MKIRSKSAQSAPPLAKPDARDRATAKLVEKSLVAEHKRWNMPLLGWKDGKITETQP